jgi:hypothetical protein
VTPTEIERLRRIEAAAKVLVDHSLAASHIQSGHIDALRAALHNTPALAESAPEGQEEP